MSQLLCAMLRSAGHQATPAFDGASALMAAMRAPAPDLIVLDLGMPAGGGQATLTNLKKSARTNQIPVIVVTANKDPGTHQELVMAGAAAYLEKPVSPDNFIAAIEAFGPKS